MASPSAEVDITLDGLESINVPTNQQPSESLQQSNPTMDAAKDVSKDDEEPDIGPIFPDHYYGDGKIPVFKPVSLICAPI